MLRGLLAVSLLCLPGSLPAYSVLTHEAIIDSAWTDSIEPLLRTRFPNATEDQRRRAHAFSYGGAIVQDLGYYPFGSIFFSDLVHYVRTGDFVAELIRQAQDLNEYAFALGALAHYASDNCGHPQAVNPSVAIEYPKLRRRYGDRVTYEDDRVAHLKVEFGFDVVEVAQGDYASQSYHDFIGFEVSKRLLESAFQTTYGLRMHDVFVSEDLALGSYRRAVSRLIPEATKVAWKLNKDKIQKARPNITRQQFLYHLSRSSYRREWGKQYDHPGPFAAVLAALFRLLPKFGPFHGVRFKPPTQQTEQLFMQSFNTTLERYKALLHETGSGRLQLVNRNLDTGNATREGNYRLADDVYAKLARTLAEKHFAMANAAVQKDVLAYFAAQRPNAAERHKDRWRSTERALAELRSWTAVPSK